MGSAGGSVAYEGAVDKAAVDGATGDAQQDGGVFFRLDHGTEACLHVHFKRAAFEPNGLGHVEGWGLFRRAWNGRESG